MKKAIGDQTAINAEGSPAARQPVVITAQGQVRCAACRTDLYGLSKTQESDDHIGVRFKNHQPEGFSEVWKWSIKLNGVEQMPEVFEAKPGKEGYVVVYHTVPDLAGPRRVICQHSRDLYGTEGAHPLIKKLFGNVTVEKVPMPTLEQQQADAELRSVEAAADRRLTDQLRDVGP